MKTSAAFLAIVTFWTNSLFAHTLETNFWTERRSVILPQRETPPNSPRRVALIDEQTTQDVGDLPVEKTQGGISLLHIQDVHLNQEAQLDISRLIQEHLQKGTVDLIAVEGILNENHLNLFRQFPHPAALGKAADFLLRTHDISGPLHAIFKQPRQTVPMFSIDDTSHYKANIDAYRQALALTPAIKTQWRNEMENIAARKKQAFNPALFALDQIVEEYRSGRLPIGSFLTSIKTQRTPAIHSFLTALELEAELNFQLVEQEQNRLRAELIHKLQPHQIKQLNQLTLEHLCQIADIRMERYPETAKYLRYRKHADQIVAEKLLEEIRTQEIKALLTLAKTEEERTLVAESRRLYLTGKLIDFALTKEEWGEYRYLQSVSPGPLVSRSPGHDDKETWGQGDGGKRFKSFEAFYEEAETRDRRMAENLLAAIKKYNAKRVVVVTGGFHTKGIHDVIASEAKQSALTRLNGRKLVSEKQIASVAENRSFAMTTFTPRITKLDTENGSSYLSVFTQEKAPLEKLFRGEKLFLSPPSLKADSAALAVSAQAAFEAPNPQTTLISGFQWFGRIFPMPHVRRVKQKSNTLRTSLQFPGETVELNHRFSNGGELNGRDLSLAPLLVSWNILPAFLIGIVSKLFILLLVGDSLHTFSFLTVPLPALIGVVIGILAHDFGWHWSIGLLIKKWIEATTKESAGPILWWYSWKAITIRIPILDGVAKRWINFEMERNKWWFQILHLLFYRLTITFSGIPGHEPGPRIRYFVRSAWLSSFIVILGSEALMLAFGRVFSEVDILTFYTTVVVLNLSTLIPLNHLIKPIVHTLADRIYGKENSYKKRRFIRHWTPLTTDADLNRLERQLGQRKYIHDSNIEIVTDPATIPKPQPGQQVIVIFDIHGTVLEPTWRWELFALLDRMVDWSDQKIRRWIDLTAGGRITNNVIEDVAEAINRPLPKIKEESQRVKHEIRESHKLSAVPKAKDLIREWKKRGAIIVAITGAPTNTIQKQLRDAQLQDHFVHDKQQTIFGRSPSEPPPESRADLEAYRLRKIELIKSRFGLQNPFFISFNDWHGDAQAMRAVNGISIGFPRGAHSDERTENRLVLLREPPVDLIVEDYNEIQKLIRFIFGDRSKYKKAQQDVQHTKSSKRWKWVLFLAALWLAASSLGPTLGSTVLKHQSTNPISYWMTLYTWALSITFLISMLQSIHARVKGHSKVRLSRGLLWLSWLVLPNATRAEFLTFWTRPFSDKALMLLGVFFGQLFTTFFFISSFQAGVLPSVFTNIGTLSFVLTALLSHFVLYLWLKDSKEKFKPRYVPGALFIAFGIFTALFNQPSDGLLAAFIVAGGWSARETINKYILGTKYKHRPGLQARLHSVQVKLGYYVASWVLLLFYTTVHSGLITTLPGMTSWLSQAAMEAQTGGFLNYFQPNLLILVLALLFIVNWYTFFFFNGRYSLQGLNFAKPAPPLLTTFFSRLINGDRLMLDNIGGALLTGLGIAFAFIKIPRYRFKKPRAAKAKNIATNPLWNWTLAIPAHELGHVLMVIPVLILAMVYILPVYIWRNITIPLKRQTFTETVRAVFQSNLELVEFVTSYFPTHIQLFNRRAGNAHVSIPGMKPHPQWNIPHALGFGRHTFEFLIALAGPFGLPLLSAWYIPFIHSHLTDLSPPLDIVVTGILLLHSLMTLALGFINVFSPTAMADPDSDGNRILHALGLTNMRPASSLAKMTTPPISLRLSELTAEFIIMDSDPIAERAINIFEIHTREAMAEAERFMAELERDEARRVNHGVILVGMNEMLEQPLRDLMRAHNLPVVLISKKALLNSHGKINVDSTIDKAVQMPPLAQFKNDWERKQLRVRLFAVTDIWQGLGVWWKNALKIKQAA